MPKPDHRRPSSMWAHALDYLARREAERLSEFYKRTASYFEDQRKELFERSEDVEEDTEAFDSLLDERDELEGFLQDNRYFAIARAWGNFERVRDRIIFAAVHLRLLPDERFVKNNMVVPRAAWDALNALGVVIPRHEMIALQTLRETRNTIMHQGGMVKRKNSNDPDVVEAMKFTDEEVIESLALSLKMTRYIVESFKVSQGGENNE